jgi:hypothetical protein
VRAVAAARAARRAALKTVQKILTLRAGAARRRHGPRAALELRLRDSLQHHQGWGPL